MTLFSDICPLIVVLSAPSGGGKSSLAQQLLKEDRQLALSVSTTTRQARASEHDGKNYFFKTLEEFTQMIIDQKFLEYAKIYNNFYGTPKKYVDDKLKSGFDMLFDIDTQGAYQIKDKMPARFISIFIVPPSLDILKQRLKYRGQDTEEVISLRLSLAQNEMSHAKNYDYVVINDDFEKAVKEVQNIITLERNKRKCPIKHL